MVNAHLSDEYRRYYDSMMTTQIILGYRPELHHFDMEAALISTPQPKVDWILAYANSEVPRGPTRHIIGCRKPHTCKRDQTTTWNTAISKYKGKDIFQAATHEKALADKDAVEFLLNAILLRYAGIVIPIGEHDEEREEYLATIRREVDTRDGVTCSSTWSCRPFEDILGALIIFIVRKGIEVSSITPPGALTLSEHNARSIAMAQASNTIRHCFSANRSVWLSVSLELDRKLQNIDVQYFTPRASKLVRQFLEIFPCHHPR